MPDDNGEHKLVYTCSRKDDTALCEYLDAKRRGDDELPELPPRLAKRVAKMDADLLYQHLREKLIARMR